MRPSRSSIQRCCAMGVSIRRTCRVFEVDTSTYHYKSRRPGQAALEPRIKEICQTRVRYGYQRIHVLLRREGWCHGQNKTRRIYRELALNCSNKAPKRRVKAKLRDDRRPATRSNETWAMDFVHDQLATGRKLRVLTIVDTFSRFSPALEPRFHSAALMLWRFWKESATKWDSRQRTVSIKAPS
jgi:putative transposase